MANKPYSTLTVCENSRLIAGTFCKQGIHAAHADSKTPGERESIMRRFKNGEIKVLCNVDLISEGFNVPDCEVVILMRPTASLVLHIQQSMRSMRYKPDKQAIVVDYVGNYERHGLPDTERDWLLKGREKDKKSMIPNSIGLTDCPHCYGVIPSGTNPCSLCGEAIEIEAGKNSGKNQRRNSKKSNRLNLRRIIKSSNTNQRPLKNWKPLKITIYTQKPEDIKRVG